MEEENILLHNRIQAMNDDLQNMTKQYNECRSEIEEKTYELERLRSNNDIEEQKLNETILQLEEKIEGKEAEILNKEIEIQRITDHLMEQQLSTERLMTSGEV